MSTPEDLQFGTGPFLVGGAPISVGGNLYLALGGERAALQQLHNISEHFTAPGGGGQVHFYQAQYLLSLGGPALLVSQSADCFGVGLSPGRGEKLQLVFVGR